MQKETNVPKKNVIIDILRLVLENNQVVVNHPNANYLSYTIPLKQMSLIFKLYCTSTKKCT